MSWHVRITMDGVATCDEGGQILRFRPGSDKGPLVLISRAWPGVEVEDVTPPRAWSDGDVVQHPESDLTWTRVLGEWVPGNGKVGRALDDEVDEWVTHVSMRVLRYQAGE